MTVANINNPLSMMTLNEYGSFTAARWMGGVEGNLQLKDYFVMTVGLAGEVGEVCELLKNHVGDGIELDNKNLIKELGDVLYYLVRIATAFNIEPQKLMNQDLVPTIRPSVSINEYGRLVRKHWFDGIGDGAILADHYAMTTGLFGKVGQVCELLKKHVRDEKELDIKALSESLSGVLYYLLSISMVFSVSPQEIINQNVDKLNGRLKRGTLQGSGNDR